MLRKTTSRINTILTKPISSVQTRTLCSCLMLSGIEISFPFNSMPFCVCQAKQLLVLLLTSVLVPRCHYQYQYYYYFVRKEIYCLGVFKCLKYAGLRRGVSQVCMTFPVLSSQQHLPHAVLRPSLFQKVSNCWKELLIDLSLFPV